MKRISTWEARLLDYIASVRREPFAWGTHDCCIFSAGAVEAVTGEDPMPEFRGKYNTALGSARALDGKSLEEVLDEKFEEVPVGFAQRGDLAWFTDCVGVVAGGYAWFVGEEGLERVERSMWDKTWRVGRG